MNRLSRYVAEGSCGSQPPVILLVEDELIVREVTCQVLEYAGYQVLQATGPEEAIRIATDHAGQIRLLLTDVVMPGMNGAELAEQLERAHPDLVTVFMSGYAEADVLRNAMRRRPLIHIQKPFTVDLLLARLADALHPGLGDEQAAGSASVSC